MSRRKPRSSNRVVKQKDTWPFSDVEVSVKLGAEFQEIILPQVGDKASADRSVRVTDSKIEREMSKTKTRSSTKERPVEDYFS